jgi:hypothetical protein
MDFLNSQHLTAQDGFIHPFREAGTFSYSAPVSDFGKTKSGMITVEEAKTAIGKGQQHDIMFHWDTSARLFVPRDEDMKKVIKQNDFVVFQFCRPEVGQPTCFIAGRQGEKAEFDSRHLRTHEAFTHFFLTAGEHAYQLGRVTYRISVTDHRQVPAEDYEKRASEALVITVSGKDISVKHAKIVAGQTIIWAVEKGENISVEGGDLEDPSQKNKAVYGQRTRTQASHSR